MSNVLINCPHSTFNYLKYYKYHFSFTSILSLGHNELQIAILFYFYSFTKVNYFSFQVTAKIIGLFIFVGSHNKLFSIGKWLTLTCKYMKTALYVHCLDVLYN